MGCPSCGHLNREGARFCAECFASLLDSITCPRCGDTHPPGAKFGDSCGETLRQAAGADLDTNIPDHLAEKIRSTRRSVEARTAGAYIHTPTLDLQRDPLGGASYFGLIPAIPYYPWPGSALVVWDAGKPNSSCSLGVGAPPLTNTPPVDGCPAGVPSSQWGANDPHEFPRNTVAARLQKSEFDEPNGKVYDVCGGQPCHSTNYSGIP